MIFSSKLLHNFRLFRTSKNCRTFTFRKFFAYFSISLQYVVCTFVPQVITTVASGILFTQINSTPETCDQLEAVYNFFIQKAEKILLAVIGALFLFYGRAFVDPLLHMALNTKIRNFILCKPMNVISPKPTPFHKCKFPPI